MLTRHDFVSLLNEIYTKIINVKKKSKVQRRLLKAFPNMNDKNRNEGLKYLKEILKEKVKWYTFNKFKNKKG